MLKDVSQRETDVEGTVGRDLAWPEEGTHLPLPYTGVGEQAGGAASAGSALALGREAT